MEYIDIDFPKLALKISRLLKSKDMYFGDKKGSNTFNIMNFLFDKSLTF